MSKKKIEIFQSVIDRCNIHASRLQMACKHIIPLLPLQAEKMLILTDEELGFTELLMSRFGKLQDTIGAHLFPLLLHCLQQSQEPLSFLDLLHHLERFELLPSKKEWIAMRDLRNHLRHEYPNDPQLMASYLNQAVTSSQSLLKYWSFLKKRAEQIKTDWTKEFT